MPTDAKSPSSPLASDIPVYRNAQNSRDATKSLMRFMESPTQEGLEVNIEEQKICEACDEKVAPIWNCSYCGMDFCDPCWTRQAPHKPGRTGPVSATYLRLTCDTWTDFLNYHRMVYLTKKPVLLLSGDSRIY